MKLLKEVEDNLLSFVKEVFQNAEWDYFHTLACVSIMKKLILIEGGDERILVPVMYLHDIGYAGQLKNGYTLEQRLKVKKNHMLIGAKKAKLFLDKIGFSSSEIKKICNLIKVHDNLIGKKSFEETLVIEADSLGQIAPSVSVNNFGEDEFAKYVEIFEKKRVPMFKTRTGKKLLEVFVNQNKLFLKCTKSFKK